MKGRVIVLNDDPGHAALVVDGRLDDLLLAGRADAAAARPPLPGEIWLATLDRRLPGQNAAFVRLGAHQGYLRDAGRLRDAGPFPVQVAGIAEPGKAIPVERRLLVKGRTLILTPDAPGVNVSRAIRDPDERARLQAAVQAPDPGTGIIVRSAARGAGAAVLAAELALLRARLADVTGDGATGIRTSPADEALREWTADPVDLIAVSRARARSLGRPEALALFGCDPELRDLIGADDGDPFEHFGVWDQIERLKGPRADLPSGGWMAVEATRAMVAVDVNTADQFGAGAAMTANIEAARELPRQLRLRGLGGQVTVDFAPVKKMHRTKLEETLKAAFRRDPVATTLAGWTPLGNFELQRKRERRPLAEVL